MGKTMGFWQSAKNKAGPEVIPGPAFSYLDMLTPDQPRAYCHGGGSGRVVTPWPPEVA
jgi:hypothetical protein